MEDNEDPVALSVEEQLSSLRCEMIFNLCAVVLVLGTLEQRCSIPIQTWMVVYNLIAFTENAADYF